MKRPMYRIGMPVGGGLDLLLLGGAAYFAWEHEQGKHEKAHLLCLICWLNRMAPATDRPDGSAADSQE
jgi:hypothetical protein